MAITRRTLIAGLAVAPAMAHAAYPDRAIRVVVPFPPGGVVDVTARVVFARLSVELGNTPIVIENVPGAGGNVATQRVARAEPDGYTLLFTTPNHTINPSLRSDPTVDVVRDFIPLSLVAQVPEVLVSARDAPFKTFQEFVDYARAHPNELAYSSAGIGSHPHVAMELLLRRLKLQVLHVPYRGAAPALTDLVAGRVALKLDAWATASPHIKAGSIRALAFASAQRAAVAPDVPTIAELGVPGFEGILWMGALVPKGTPSETCTTLSKALAAAAKDPQVAERLMPQGVDLIGSTPDVFAAQIEREIPQWREVISAANIRPE